MYNPDLGTFIQRDPIEYDPNLYSYGGNNPVCQLDPDGLSPIPPDTGVRDPDSFFEWWKKQTVGMTDEQLAGFRKTLEIGCQGVVAVYLGYSNPQAVGGEFASQFTRGYKTLQAARNAAAQTKCPGQDCYGQGPKATIVAVMFEFIGVPPGKTVQEQMRYLKEHPGWKADPSWLDKEPIDLSAHWSDVNGKGSFDFAVCIPGASTWLGGTGGENTPDNPTHFGSDMTVTQRGDESIAASAKKWKSQRKQYVVYCVVCPKDFSAKPKSAK